MKIYTQWIKHLKSKKEKEDFLNIILLPAIPALERLQEIIEGEKRNTQVLANSKDTYKNTNWACLQADALGEQRAYNNILRLISLKGKQ